MRKALSTRVAKLEGRCPAADEPPYVPPAPPPGWTEEVLRLLWDSGHLRIVLEETFHLPPAEVTWLMALAATDFQGLVKLFDGDEERG